MRGTPLRGTPFGRCRFKVLFTLRFSFLILQGKIKEPKPKLFGLDIFGWGEGLRREGVGAKKFGMSFETQGNQAFWRDIPGVCRDIPGL